VAEQHTEAPGEYQLIGPSEDGEVSDLLSGLSAKAKPTDYGAGCLFLT
jgi:hypothetical protein